MDQFEPSRLDLRLFV